MPCPIACTNCRLLRDSIRVLLGQQGAVFSERTRYLPAFRAWRRRQHLKASLPHHRQDIQLKIGFGDLALAHDVEYAEPDIRLPAGGGNAEPIALEAAGQITAAANPFLAADRGVQVGAFVDAAHEDVRLVLEIGKGVKQGRPEAGDGVFRAKQLVDGRRNVPIHVIVNGGSHRLRNILAADMVQLLPEIPDRFFVLLIQLCIHHHPSIIILPLSPGR